MQVVTVRNGTAGERIHRSSEAILPPGRLLVPSGQRTPSGGVESPSAGFDLEEGQPPHGRGFRLMDGAADGACRAYPPNAGALGAWLNLVKTTSGLSKTLERLSSGRRINRASDAVGLAIPEKMWAQIRGLN